MKKFMMVIVLVSLTACGTNPKPAPKWPDGDERPINAQPITKTGARK